MDLLCRLHPPFSSPSHLHADNLDRKVALFQGLGQDTLDLNRRSITLRQRLEMVSMTTLRVERTIQTHPDHSRHHSVLIVRPRKLDMARMVTPLRKMMTIIQSIPLSTTRNILLSIIKNILRSSTQKNRNSNQGQHTVRNQLLLSRPLGPSRCPIAGLTVRTRI